MSACSDVCMFLCLNVFMFRCFHDSMFNGFNAVHSIALISSAKSFANLYSSFVIKSSARLKFNRYFDSFKEPKEISQKFLLTAFFCLAYPSIKFKIIDKVALLI